MTGFGAASAPWRGQTLRVEIGGVNRKQAEIAVSLPRAWNALEPRVRGIVAGVVSRGRVNVSVSVQDAEGDTAPAKLVLHEDLLAELQNHLARVCSIAGATASLTVEGLMRAGVLEMREQHAPDPEESWPTLEELVMRALKDFNAMRTREGETLRRDLLTKIGSLRALRAQMIKQAAGVPAKYREALTKRLADAALPIALDDERLVKEIALFADRCDVSEESVRLASHFDQFEAICAQDEPAGRPLDFLCQEIFRELNTTGSKANDAGLAQLVVAAKTELEKIREQAQNIE